MSIITKSFITAGLIVALFMMIFAAFAFDTPKTPKPSAGKNAVMAQNTEAPYFTGPEVTFADVIVMKTLGGDYLEVIQGKTLYTFYFTGATGPFTLKVGDRINLTVQPVYNDHTFYFRHAEYLRKGKYDPGPGDIQFIPNTLTLTTPEEEEQ